MELNPVNQETQTYRIIQLDRFRFEFRGVWCYNCKLRSDDRPGRAVALSRNLKTRREIEIEGVRRCFVIACGIACRWYCMDGMGSMAHKEVHWLYDNVLLRSFQVEGRCRCELNELIILFPRRVCIMTHDISLQRVHAWWAHGNRACIPGASWAGLASLASPDQGWPIEETQRGDYPQHMPDFKQESKTLSQSHLQFSTASGAQLLRYSNKVPWQHRELTYPLWEHPWTIPLHLSSFVFCFSSLFLRKTLGMEGQHLHFTAKGKLEMSRRSKKHLQRWIRCLAQNCKVPSRAKQKVIRVESIFSSESISSCRLVISHVILCLQLISLLVCCLILHLWSMTSYAWRYRCHGGGCRGSQADYAGLHMMILMTPCWKLMTLWPSPEKTELAGKYRSSQRVVTAETADGAAHFCFCTNVKSW